MNTKKIDFETIRPPAYSILVDELVEAKAPGYDSDTPDNGAPEQGFFVLPVLHLLAPAIEEPDT